MKKYIKQLAIIFVILAFVLASAGCANMSRTQQTTLSGAAIGAAGGGVLGAIGGSPLTGAAIGAGVGALGGYIVGEEGKGYKSHR